MQICIVGTGTNVGKTLFSSLVMAKYAISYNISYWKPIQTGSDDDTATVLQLSGLDQSHTYPNLYHFALPASPHFAAEQEQSGVGIGLLQEKILQQEQKNLLIEWAGGLMVPLNRQTLSLDLLAELQIPVILVVSSELGTINHSLLSLEALQSRKVPIIGYYFIGPDSELTSDNIRTIAEFSGEEFLGHFVVSGALPVPLGTGITKRFDTTSQISRLFSA
ncbi:MAG: dethiobiotin synthase [Spirochaetota bacterium]